MAPEAAHGSPAPIFQRRKRFVNRSRTGCMTCRVRRIKCDEAKPACINCTSARRTCGGYESQSKLTQPQDEDWLTHPVEESLSHALKHSQGNIQGPLVAAMPGHGFGQNTSEKSLFWFFRNSGASLLADDLDAQLFNSVFQAGHTYPCIRHATLALAASTRSSLAATGFEEDEWTALKHMNKSIKELLEINDNKLSHADKSAVLITAILFVCVNLMRGDVETSIFHAEAGLKLYNEWMLHTNGMSASTQSRRLPFGLDMLVAIYARLDNQARVVMGMPRLKASPVLRIEKSWQPLDPTKAFGDIECLLNDILQVLDAAHVRNQSDQQNDDEFERARSTFRDRLATWDREVADYEKSLDDLNDSKVEKFRPLRIRRFQTEAILTAATVRGSTEWDRCLPQFEAIVKLADQSLTTRAAVTSRPLFNLSSSMVEALTMTTLRCRDSKTRRKALHLLKDQHSKEALITKTGFNTGFAERFIDVEDGDDRKSRSCCRDTICTAHRVDRVRFVLPGTEPECLTSKDRTASLQEGVCLIISCEIVRHDLDPKKSFNWMGMTWQWPVFVPQASVKPSHHRSTVFLTTLWVRVQSKDHAGARRFAQMNEPKRGDTTKWSLFVDMEIGASDAAAAANCNGG